MREACASVVRMVRGHRVAGACSLALLAVGCGGSSGDDASSSTSASSSAPAVVVSTKKVPGYGTVLTNQAGRPLYILTADPDGASKCSGDCAKQWPPLSGSPKADANVKSDLLGSFKRDDGTVQVTYNKHALYTNTGEALGGVGTKALGGVWYLVSPEGKAIESTTAGGY
jgi:predicted lipoprotein with Yx(FWY)xxD motif